MIYCTVAEDLSSGVAVCYETVHWTVSPKSEIWNRLSLVRVLKKQKRKNCVYTVLSFLAPQVGLEPTTLRLTAACSTD